MKSTRISAYRKLLDGLVRGRRGARQTQAELARRLGKPQSYISKVESGERRLDLVEYVYWCKALSIDPADLISALGEAIELPRQSRPRKRVLGKTA